MFGSFRTSATQRSLRAAAPLLILLSAMALLPIAACNSGDTFAPSDDTPMPATEPAEAAPPSTVITALGAAERISFMSYRDGNANLYKMDPWGKQVVRLTNTADEDQEPAWSYDNKKIAMVRARVDGGVARADIWLVNADGTNGHWLRSTPSPWHLMDPSWSPDGTHLLVVMWISPYWYLAKLEVATGNVTLIHPSGGGIIGSRPSYDKAGKRIIYIGSAGRTVEQIYPDGTGHKVRYSTTTARVDHPSFSPDGKRIAFEKGSIPGNSDIFVKDLTTGVVTRLNSSTASDRNATWSPDGTTIAFMSDRSGVFQIWTLNSTTGGSLTRITHTSTAELSPAWSH